MDPHDIARAAASGKYAHMDMAAIVRIVFKLMPGYKKRQPLITAFKKELHIASEAYMPKANRDKAYAAMNAYSGQDIASDKDFSRFMMSLHASANERLPEAEDIYAFISKYTKDMAVADI